jgi:hypothetical protein
MIQSEIHCSVRLDMLDRGWLSVLYRRTMGPNERRSGTTRRTALETTSTQTLTDRLYSSAQLVGYGNQRVGELDGGKERG